MNSNSNRFAISLALKVSHLHDFSKTRTQYAPLTHALSHWFASLIILFEKKKKIRFKIRWEKMCDIFDFLLNATADDIHLANYRV